MRVMLVVVLVAALLPAGAAAERPNLLANPSFEGGGYRASMSNFIPEGWGYWFRHREPDEQRLYWMPEPEFGLIRDREGQSVSGPTSARWFNIWAIHDAGLYQRVRVPRDATLRFSIWALSWSAQHDVWRRSDSWQHRWVGIDPNGGTDAFSPDVVWSASDATMDEWVRLSVTARARGEWATVFVRERPDWPVKHNDCLVDDAELVAIDAPVPAPAAPAPLGAEPAAGTVTDFAYHELVYPGGGRVVTINMHAATTDGVGFRVYGPGAGRVYARSGAQPGLVPNLSGDLVAAEPGTYVVQVFSDKPVDYRIWSTHP